MKMGIFLDYILCFHLDILCTKSNFFKELCFDMCKIIISQLYYYINVYSLHILSFIALKLQHHRVLDLLQQSTVSSQN